MFRIARNSPFCGRLFFVAVIALHGLAPRAAANQVRRDLKKDDLPEVVFTGSAYDEVARRLTIRLARPPAQIPKQDLATSADGRFDAYTIFQPNPKTAAVYRYPDHIFFSDLRTGHAYEIRGLPDPHRPFSYLLFTNARILQFDRWASPHHGIRYRFDVRRRKLISARSFVEAEYINLMKKTQKKK